MKKIILICAAFILITGLDAQTFAAGDDQPQQAPVVPKAPSKAGTRKPLTSEEIEELVIRGGAMAAWQNGQHELVEVE
jgi:hypothetical protein